MRNFESIQSSSRHSANSRARALSTARLGGAGSIADDIESLVTIGDCEGGGYLAQKSVRSTTLLEDFEDINKEDNFINILGQGGNDVLSEEG